jgi:hypothetical protein
MVALIVYVTVLPAGKFTAVSSMLPEPPVVKPVAPPVCAAVYVAPVSELGKVSAIVAPVTALVPVLVATTVYVIAWPGTAVPVALETLDPPRESVV